MGMKAPPCFAFGALLLISSAAAMAQNAMTTEGADLYAGPDNSYPVVAQLDPNTPIQVNGCLDDWSWCDVSLQDSRGWMYSPDITYQYQGDYVPLYNYAPSLGIAVVPFSVDAYWGRYYHDRPWYSRRDEWVHRTVNHRRPPGPPPSAGPPPRPEHRDGPREAQAHEHDRPMHLGSAGSAEPAPQHRNDQRRNDERKPEPPPPRPETHTAPAPHPETHALPSPHEDRAHPASPPAHAAAPTHEERPRPAPSKEEEHPH